MGKKSAIYIRVSTSHQIDKDSLPLQRKDLINYSKIILGIKDYEIFEDAGFSAKNTDRPAFQKMITKIRNGEFTHLLVWKIDRISRNLLDFCSMYDELKKYNCTFISKNEQFDTSNAIGEAMLKIILVFAELERKMTGERVTSVMLDRASKGLWNGAPVPLGYSFHPKTKYPEVIDEEATTVHLIYDMYEKYKSTSSVRNYLNQHNIKTKRNGTWTTKTISDIIRNPFYIGTYRYNYRESARGKIKPKEEWIVVEDNHPALINKELWTSCNNIMDQNSERNSSAFRDNSKIHVLAGLIVCGECNKVMYSKQDKPNLDGFIPSLYTCQSRYNKLGCTQKTISEKQIATFILNFISKILKLNKMKAKNFTTSTLEKYLLDSDCFKSIDSILEIDNLYNYLLNPSKFIFNHEVSTDDAKEDYNVTVLSNELIKYQKALTKLEDLFLFDDMSKKDYLLKKKNLKDKIVQLTKKIDEAASTSSSIYSNAFIIETINFELSSSLINDQIDYKLIVQGIGRTVLKDFFNTLLSKIIVLNKEIKVLEFKNGLNITFIYNS